MIGSLLLRRASKLPNQSPVGENLVASANCRNVERQGRVMGGQHDLKPVPRHAAKPFVALIGYRLVGAKQLPPGVVEAGIGPAKLAVRVVAGSEAIEAIELGHLHARLLKVEDLGASRWQNQKSQQQSRYA